MSTASKSLFELFGRFLSFGHIPKSSAHSSTSRHSPSQASYARDQNYENENNEDDAEDDLIVKAIASDEVPTMNAQLQVSMTTEYDEIPLKPMEPFHVNVSVKFPESLHPSTQRSSMDVVCILDVSGSMSSNNKINNLRKAVEFVIGTLSENDRLAIVTFESQAKTIQGFKNMTGDGKRNARNAISRLAASGGTDIYDGMRRGWDLVEKRRSKAENTCVFLLTDGQDTEYLEEKKGLAKSMREAGCSLFLFGFGADHDSQHMNSIANAAEGSFIYIDTSDTVIDAFGGAIGSQQGSIMRSIEVHVRCSNNGGVKIKALQAGKYSSSVSLDQTSGSVRFKDMFCGESRDFLALLYVPGVESPIPHYPLIESFSLCHYDSRSKSNALGQKTKSTVVACSVGRVRKDSCNASDRHIDVDTQIIRFRTAEVINQAIGFCDINDFKSAITLLNAMKGEIKASVANKHGSSICKNLLLELEDSLTSMESKVIYTTSGGRACLEETMSVYGTQRMVFKKEKAVPRSEAYQIKTSLATQSVATLSKSRNSQR